MRVVDYQTIKHTQGITKTAQDFGHFLGTKPEKLGLVSSMYEDLTATYLTEALRNIYFNGKKGTAFQPIDALAFEWEIDVEFIKRVEIAAAPTGTGANGAEITMSFKEKYYDKYDTFVIEGSRQQCIVVAQPRRKADNLWDYQVRLVGSDFNQTLDSDFVRPGSFTRWRSNYHPELSEKGYSKYQSNIEKHRNHISLHRVDVEWSSQFAVMEDVYLKTAEKGEEVYYKMKKKEKECLDTWMKAKNNHLMWGKTNFDKNGKCTIQDPATGRDIPMGDGIIPQIERFADKAAFSKLSVALFEQAMSTMRQKAKSPQGNQWIFVCNERMYDQVQQVLRDWIKDFRTDGTFFYSKQKGGSVKVGATFDTYEIAGNHISFKIDRALSHEYNDRAYGVFLDLTGDMNTGKPAIAQFTLRGSEMISGNLKGMGGLNGTTSGDIASPVAGSKHIIMGYSGVGVFNAYRSFILEENVA